MENPAILLDRYIRARYPIIVILTHEELRVTNAINAIASDKKRPARLIEWSYTKGLKEETSHDGVREYQNTEDPIPALQMIMTAREFAGDEPKLFVFRDLHPMLNDAKVIRQLRDIVETFSTTKNNLILISPSMQIPTDLEKTAVVIDWPLPNTDELSAILAACEQTLPEKGRSGRKIKVDLVNGSRERVIQSMQGLTAFEAENVLLSAVVATEELGESAIPHIVKEKAQIIRKSGVLEFYDTTVTMNNVGGLGYLKQYASIKRAAFSAKARAAGVDTPKGVLLVGIPGTGKSLSAKAIAGGELPLLRMDIGALMGGLVGQSEANMRSALKVAEAVAPCVLWVDEIEKGLATGGELDGGTSSRVFGTILTWMQETTAPVYVIATANNAATLKPELLRRFDDIFWVDLPNANSRREIFGIHLDKRGYDASLVTDELVSLSWGMSGAEVEKVVKSAVENAFFEETDLSASHLLAEVKRIIPVSRTMDQQIAKSREWANNRARFASEPLEPEPVLSNRPASTRVADL